MPARNTTKESEMRKVTIVTERGAEVGYIINRQDDGAILFNYARGLSRWIEAGQFVTEGR